VRHIKQEKVDWNTFSGLGVFGYSTIHRGKGRT